jgi:small-conductance mechanosensitive channel
MTSLRRFQLSLPTAVLITALPLFAQANAAPALAATNAAAATPPPIALADVVTQAQTIIASCRDTLADVNPDQVVQGTQQAMPALQGQIADRLAADRHFGESNPGASALQTSRTDWKTIAGKLDDAQTALTARVRKLDNDLATFNTAATTWKVTMDNAAKQSAPPDVLARMADARTQIDAAQKAITADLRTLYTLQNEVASLAQDAKTGLDSVDKELEAFQAQLIKQTQPALWEPAALTASAAGAVTRERLSFTQQVAALQTYTADHTGAILIHFLLFALLAAGFHYIRKGVHARATSEAGLRDAELIFTMPVSTALLLSLFATAWLYPLAPRLFLAIIGAVALVPTVIIMRRLISPSAHPLLYVTVFTYVIDQIRYVATPAGVFSRFVLLAEVVLVALFALGLLRSPGLQVVPLAPPRLRITRAYLHLAFFVFVASGFANFLGYVMLAYRLADGMLESSYLAVTLFAAVRILNALALAVLCLRPVSDLGMIQRHRDLVYDKVVRIIRALVVAVWALAALVFFVALGPVAAWLEGVLDYTLAWGTIHVEVGALVAFPFTVWAAFALSRFIRFSLEEEVYPNLNLPRGIPYAVSTMVHYAVLVVGFVIALGAMNINLSSFALLASAFGVGLGFGLQNIMNNFISGLILLFERPIKVGDTIQIDPTNPTTMGRVERIGIRASIIQLTNGSELIMPNGNLISNPVYNWTLTNNARLLEIPVTVTSKVDPAHVIEIIVATAKAHKDVAPDPAPEAIVATIGASTSFKLRAWTNAERDWMRVSSELAVAIQARLAAENITLA